MGTNLGLIALMFRRYMDPKGTLVLFEPVARILRICAANLQRGGALDALLMIVNGFASSGGEFAAAHQHVWSREAGELGAWLTRLPARPPSVSLDSLCGATGLQPDFIKLDVEGAEHDVLAGARQTLRRCRPVIQVEVHTFTGTMAEHLQRVLNWCGETAYTAWYMTEYA